jgi:hypothetical protein
LAVTIVQYRTRPERADENQQLVEAVFRELHATAPRGLRYASYRLDDGVSFVHVAVLEGDQNPLARSVAFGQFQSAIGERCAEGPVAADAAVVGSYRMPVE